MRCEVADAVAVSWKRRHLSRFSIGVEAEVVELSAPIGAEVPQALDVDAAREAPFDGCLDQLRGNKRKRECQIHLAHCAQLALPFAAEVESNIEQSCCSITRYVRFPRAMISW